MNYFLTAVANSTEGRGKAECEKM